MERDRDKEVDETPDTGDDRRGIDARHPEGRRALDREAAARKREAPDGNEEEPQEQEGEIPSSRFGRSAKLGSAIGGQATR